MDAKSENQLAEKYGHPGEEHVDDDYCKNGNNLNFQTTEHSTDSSPIKEISSSQSQSSLLSSRQWHLISVADLVGHQVPVTSLTLNKDMSSFWSGDKNGHVIHWTIQQEELENKKFNNCLCKQSTSKNKQKYHKGVVTKHNCSICNGEFCDFCLLGPFKKRLTNNSKIPFVLFGIFIFLHFNMSLLCLYIFENFLCFLFCLVFFFFFRACW